MIMSFSCSGGQSFSMPFGTSIMPEGGVTFRLWAPAAEQIDLCLSIHDKKILEPMEMLEHGWFTIFHPDARAGDMYQFRVDSGLLVPDPASRYQARDVHGPSVVYDPVSFCWQDENWTGRPWEEAVVYELHVGTFSPQGTFRGIIERLDYLVELGITAIELMPLAQFPGKFNWGYDGTLLFAPYNGYGTPDDLKELVQAAHRKGLMVLLDVVYNHFGPEGNYLHAYAEEAFFKEEVHTPWGAAIDFCGPRSRTVRDFYIANTLYWLEEFHFDGLRYDAVHAIIDESDPDILEEIARQVRRGPGSSRKIHLILENDNNQAGYLRRTPEEDAPLYTAQWNDDIHHICHILLTGETTGYYADYADNPINHLGRCLTEGFAYQGEPSLYRKGKSRGTPSGHLPPAAFVSFLQNHDQIGNRAFGERIVTLSDRRDHSIITALLLLAPSPPLLFMGEEFGADNPFYFFSDFGTELAAAVTEGRRKEFARFPQFNIPEIRHRIPDPCDESTFLQSKLQWDRLDRNTDILHHYRELLHCRQRKIVPRLKGMQGGHAEYILHGEQTLEARWTMGDGADLTVLFNLHQEAVPVPSRTGNLLFQSHPGINIAITRGSIPPKSLIWLLKDQKEIHD
ncbi:MAG: malto-oligosyltrehalose trehalohydrolase [Desulfobulbaceae bacterium]|nr:malto-oligosyltrehalose trehalohydrolase [Desulfobulbaceae bacterium]